MPEVIVKIGRKGATTIVRYQAEEGLKSAKFSDSKKQGAIDVLLAGKMTALPPSIHPDTGHPYVWLDKSLPDADLADLPVLTKRKLDLLRLAVGSEHFPVLASGSGTHDAGLRFTDQLVAFGCTDDEIETLFRAALPENYDGNSLEELPEWIRSAREKGFGTPSLRSGRQRAPPRRTFCSRA